MTEHVFAFLQKFSAREALEVLGALLVVARGLSCFSWVLPGVKMKHSWRKKLIDISFPASTTSPGVGVTYQALTRGRSGSWPREQCQY